MRREFLKRIINISLISRFLAKQIDLLLLHLISFILYTFVLKDTMEYNPLMIFLPILFIGTIIEALFLYIFNTTLGKFFLGLRVYPPSLLDSFKRSFNSYIKGLGLGLPFLGWVLMGYQYLTGINQDVSWDKYGKVEQKPKDLMMGLSSLTIISLLIIASILITVMQNRQEQTLNQPDESIEKVIVDYQGIMPADSLPEYAVELWNNSCFLGALGALEYFKYQDINEDQINLIRLACEQGQKNIAIDEEPEVLYMKACGFGIGVGTSLQQGSGQVINFQGKEEELLKRICISPLEN